MLDRIPSEVLERFPRAMLTVARCCGAAWMMQHQSRLLARLDVIVDSGADARRSAARSTPSSRR